MSTTERRLGLGAMPPDDQYNRTLLEHVHPSGWSNPEPDGTYNLVVVGGGTAGLITAAVAASMGARTALVERHLLGGDCLNVGCVPSKAIIRGARAAAELRWIEREGLGMDCVGRGPDDATGTVTAGVGRNGAGRSAADESGATGAAGGPGAYAQAAGSIDIPAVLERMRRIRSEISGHDSAARYRDEFGADVFIGSAEFTGKRELQVRGDDGSVRKLSFSKAVIATGARAAAPPIPGLDSVDYLTNESVFTLTEAPASLAIVGAGPIGCEMAQSFARLGVTVDLFELMPQVLPREDADVAHVVQEALAADGVRLHLGVQVEKVAAGENGRAVVTIRPNSESAEAQNVEAERVLVAIGRAPNLEGLGLDAAGVEYGKRGVTVNRYLQTSNKRIYAAGDVATPYQFTHMAEATAGLVVQNALFLRTKTSDSIVVPWVTFTSPEVAHVGISEQDAKRDGTEIQVFTHSLGKVDRARLDGETEGFVKLIVPKGKTTILGATIVAAHAGEMIAEIVLAMQNGLGIDKLAGVVHPYPTQAEGIKRAASGYLKQKLSPRVKRIMETWFRWHR